MPLLRLLKRLLLLLVTGAIAAGSGLTWFALKPLPLPTSPREFSIPFGLSLRGASQQMSDAGLGFAPWQFTLLARLAGKAAEIKAGSYEVSQGITPWLLLDKLTRGDVTQAELLLVEGKTFRQLREELDAHPALQHDTTGLSDAAILTQLGAVESHAEGLFFPDTYLFTKRSSDLEILRRAYRAMQRRLDSEWQRRDPEVPFKTPYEALIMASIVEKETGRVADREQIAAVFANRLRLGMLLQTDPTVIYGLGKGFDGSLHRRDLTTDTPYNTYTRGGLPPTPIAMPGLAALQAALHPPKSAMLYFVARGDGSSEFSHTLDEHNRAVAKYRRGR